MTTKYTNSEQIYDLLRLLRNLGILDNLVVTVNHNIDTINIQYLGQYGPADLSSSPITTSIKIYKR